MPQLDGYLAADNIDLTDGVFDRNDAVVQPGVTLDVADTMWGARHPRVRSGPAAALKPTTSGERQPDCPRR